MIDTCLNKNIQNKINPDQDGLCTQNPASFLIMGTVEISA